MGKALVIKGHTTRGKEVIELLEMLGGINVHKHMGINDRTFYYVNDTTGIDCDQTLWNNNRYTIFTLEEFLEKYPFKVSDRVRIPEYESEVRIDKMYWDGYEIQYEVFTDEVETYSAEELNQWNESNNKTKTKMNNTQESLLKKNSITISSLCYEDEVELNFSCEYDLIERDGKHILIKKNPTYPKTYEEDNYCETLEIKVLGYKVGDVVFTNDTGWIRITNKLWDCYAKEHVYEGVGIINEQEYDNISHKDIIDKMEKYIIDKMETDSVIKNMMESITLSPHITANITDKNNCDIKCSDGYEFYDDNGNLIGNKVIMIPKKPTYPKTYDECCGVLNIPNDERYIDIDVPLDYNKLLSAFTELLICRDAYWKIAGEELGLGKSWEYDHTKGYYTPAIIYRVGFIQKIEILNKNVILAFPTIEMRNAFAENFKELIEKCKELL